MDEHPAGPRALDEDSTQALPRDEVLQRLDRMANILDSHFRIPGTDWRIGVDGLIGLIPGIGDAASAAISLYLVSEASRYDIPKTRIAHMLWNVGLDGVLGSIPLVGDLFDVGFKANRKNVDLLRRELIRKGY